MAFSASGIVTTQVVITIFFIRFFTFCERTDHIKKLINIFPLFFASFKSRLNWLVNLKRYSIFPNGLFYRPSSEKKLSTASFTAFLSVYSNSLQLTYDTPSLLYDNTSPFRLSIISKMLYSSLDIGGWDIF